MQRDPAERPAGGLDTAPWCAAAPAEPRAPLLPRLIAWDGACVRAANRLLGYRGCAAAAHCVSRLGNGELWVLLIIGLALTGEAGVVCALQAGLASLAGLAIYKLVKTRAARARPYVHLTGLCLRTPPLDEHSFPSGHTLHAVAYAVVVTAHFPSLGFVLVPFAVLTALVRVVLGLHYPSDVAAGVVIGAAVAGLSFLVFPVA